VAPRFFAVYAMPPLAGRTFTDEEERANGPGAAVLSERLWTRRFNRDPRAIGRALTIGGRSYQIVGVMPAAFTGDATDLWLPAHLMPFFAQLRDARFLNGVGRLRPNVTVHDSSRDLASVQDALARDFPRTDAGWAAEVRSLKETRVGASRRGLLLVFGAVALLWTIAIANTAGLMIVQLHRRSRELAIRAALGASRSRVIGTVIREGLILAVAGGAVGTGLAAWLVGAMPTALSSTPRINELSLDWGALGFVGGTSLLAACVFGLVPAFAATRAHLMQALGGSSRAVAGGAHRLQRLLVVGQVALSVLLVGSATLLLRSYYDLTRVDTGLDASNTMTFHVAARWDEDRARIGQLQQQLIASLEQLPHVRAAGMVNFLPAGGATLRYQVTVEGVNGPNDDGSVTVGARSVTGGYLRALRAPLEAGSWCPPITTDPKAPRAALVNRRFVDVHAPGQNLVGRSAQIVGTPGGPMTIVGVVGNMAEDGPATTTGPYLYSCLFAGAWPDPEYVVRTSDARALASDLRRVVRELDPGRAIFGFGPVQEVLDAALEQPRLDAAMLTVFAGAAVTLAALGLYSLFMLLVSERAREMAVRLAIGASPRELFQLVMSDAGRLLVTGVLLGIVLTAAADRALRGVVLDAAPLNVSALATAAATLAIISIAAVAGPALRAARTAPINALRGD
jgi:predicted permease